MLGLLPPFGYCETMVFNLGNDRVRVTFQRSRGGKISGCQGEVDKAADHVSLTPPVPSAVPGTS